MVRTECRKCKHSNKNHSACMVVRQRKDVADWMGSIETEWISPNEHMVMEQAIAPTLCPGFEATPDKSSVVAAPADTISVEPRKRSEDSNSQAILDGSPSPTPTGCQCAAGPWREDVGNAPEGGVLLLADIKKHDPAVVTRVGDYWEGGGVSRHISDITRFAVIGGK